MKNDIDAHAPTGARGMTGAEWAMLGILSVVWGGSFLFNGIAVKEMPVLSIVAFRVLLAALALQLFVRIAGITIPWTRQALIGYLGMALLNAALPFSLIVFGQTRIPSGLASILNATTPIFTMLLAHVFLASERLDGRRAMGVLLGFGGVLILLFDKAFGHGGQLIGVLTCLGASLSYGIANIFGRRFIPAGINPVAMATGQLTLAAVLVVPLALLIDQPFARAMPSRDALVALSLLGLVSTAAAYTLFFRILTRAGATNASLVTLLVPCSALVLGDIFLGETLDARALIGFITIATGLLVIDGRVIAVLSRKQA